MLTRWTPLLYVNPRWFLDDSVDWSSFDFPTWSERHYTWVADSWNGLSDFAKPANRTVADGHGDCEDYAVVALNWSHATTDGPLGVGFLYDLSFPPAGHVITFDDEYVYSSGVVRQETPAEYKERTTYDVLLTRSIR